MFLAKKLLPAVANKKIVFCGGNKSGSRVSGSAIMYSEDGESWVTVSDVLGFVCGRCYKCNGIWFILPYGESATSYATSPDCITWTVRTFPAAQRWDYLTYGNGVYVATGKTTSAYAYSNDGINWTQATLPFSSLQCEPAFGNNVWVIMEYSGSTKVVAVSSDGVTWSSVSIPFPGTTTNELCLFDGTKFVAIASEGEVYSSTNGTSWSSLSSISSGFSGDPVAAAAYGNKIAATANFGNAVYSLIKSDNGGTSWSSNYSGSWAAWQLTSFNNEFFGANAGTDPRVSIDGITWTTISDLADGTKAFYGVCAG